MVGGATLEIMKVTGLHPCTNNAKVHTDFQSTFLSLKNMLKHIQFQSQTDPGGHVRSLQSPI